MNNQSNLELDHNEAYVLKSSKSLYDSYLSDDCYSEKETYDTSMNNNDKVLMAPQNNSLQNNIYDLDCFFSL